MTRAFRQYSINVIEGGGFRRLIVERLDGRPVVCDWDTLQEIKNQYLGSEVCAVEVFPPASELVNETNRRHFWEVGAKMVPSLSRREHPCRP